MLSKLLVTSAFVLSSTVSYSATKEDAVKMVKSAVDFAKKNGKPALLKEVCNDNPMFKQGTVYIWVGNANYVTLAHASIPKMQGVDGKLFKDSNGVKFVVEAIDMAVKNGSGWTKYRFMNPATNTIQNKVVYSEKLDDIVIVSGVYE